MQPSFSMRFWEEMQQLQILLAFVPGFHSAPVAPSKEGGGRILVRNASHRKLEVVSPFAMLPDAVVPPESDEALEQLVESHSEPQPYQTFGVLTTG